MPRLEVVAERLRGILEVVSAIARVDSPDRDLGSRDTWRKMRLLPVNRVGLRGNEWVLGQGSALPVETVVEPPRNNRRGLQNERRRRGDVESGRTAVARLADGERSGGRGAGLGFLDPALHLVLFAIVPLGSHERSRLARQVPAVVVLWQKIELVRADAVVILHCQGDERTERIAIATGRKLSAEIGIDRVRFEAPHADMNRRAILNADDPRGAIEAGAGAIAGVGQSVAVALITDIRG